MTNKSTGSLLLAMVASSYAFQIQGRTAVPSKLYVETDPFREIDVDLDLAEDCAANFGKYSVEEIEYCRDELHARRVQNVAFGEDASSPDVMKERFLEEELTLQLDWLKHEMPDSYLFPDEETFDSDIDTDMDIDGLLMDNGLRIMDLPTRQDKEPVAEMVAEKKNSVMWNELAKEGVLEPIAICAFLGFVMVAPRFF